MKFRILLAAAFMSLAMGITCFADEPKAPMKFSKVDVPEWVTFWVEARQAFEKKEYEKSRELFLKAIDEVTIIYPNSRVLISIYHQLADTFEKLGDKEKEKQCLINALYYARVINTETVEIGEKLNGLGVDVPHEEVSKDPFCTDDDVNLEFVVVRNKTDYVDDGAGEDLEAKKIFSEIDGLKAENIHCYKVGKKRVTILKPDISSLFSDDELTCQFDEMDDLDKVCDEADLPEEFEESIEKK